MEIPEGMTEEQYKALMEQSGASDTGELADMGMNAMGSMDMSAIQGGDMSSLTETQKKYIASLSDEQLELMKQMLKEQSDTNADQLANSGKYSTSNYDNNMKTLGYSVVEDPDSINIYPVDFASKEKIIDIIDDYNDSVDEEDKIEYTDYVGLMMSSITSIINAISYVLIAFVAISLVVSSIMIGIITYISVLERTKEIGILRSIGASKRDISRVFNAETVIVGFVAGALGIIISYLLTIPINMIIGTSYRRADKSFNTCQCGSYTHCNKRLPDAYRRPVPVKSGGKERPCYRTENRIVYFIPQGGNYYEKAYSRKN